MRINLVIPSFYPATVYGGPIFSSLHTSQELAKLDNTEVFVSTTNANKGKKLNVLTNQWIKFEDNLYVKYYKETLVDKFSIELYMKLWKDIKMSDIVHLQAIFSSPIPIAVIISIILKKPILLSPRGALCEWCIGQGNNFKIYWLKLFIQPFIKRISWHATCEAEKKDILKIFSNSDVSIIPNGVDIDEYSKFNLMDKQVYLKKYTNLSMDKSHIVISMSRLHIKKGFDILILSFIDVLQKYPDAVLIIAGPDEGEKDHLLEMIKELNVEDKVFIINPISGQDKIDFLANADVFALASHNENFGNVYIESLAAGTPIVASKGTPWEEVEKFNCGKWVENNVDETAKAIISLFNEDRENLRNNAYAFSKKYNWNNIAFKFKDLFNTILNQK